jgi:hypothetical protein
VTGPPQYKFLRSTTRRRVSLSRIKEKAIRQAEDNVDVPINLENLAERVYNEFM